MKKIFISCLTLIVSLCLCGCSMMPFMGNSIRVREMKEISELASVECYFHNVAKSDKDLNPTWYEFWKKKNMHFWIEYDGVVTIGIDSSKLKVDIQDNEVTITLPEAKVLGAKVYPETLTEESFYYDPDTKKPDASEQGEAFRRAQEEMIASAEANHALMDNARENAKELLENYIKSVGDATGIEYTVNWVYLDSENNTPTETTDAE